MIKKFLQKIFKIVSYGIFFKIYGKIEESVKSVNHDKIKVIDIDIEKNLNYKVYKILDGRLYSDRIHDTAIIINNKIIEEPSFQLRYKHDANIYNSEIKNNIVFKKGTPRKLKYVNGSLLSLLTGGAGNDNYWHWLYDVLPRFGLCNKVIDLSKIDYFLLPDLKKKFQNETLDCLNIPKEKRLSSRKHRHLTAKESIVTDHPVVINRDPSKSIQDIPDWIMSWLKKSFINQRMKDTRKEKKKIYIDRKDTIISGIPQRLLINEEEVKTYLLNNNFISVKLHDIKFIEQVDLFYNAECIVGLHGAGLGNLTFCQPGTKVIELKGFHSGPVIENLAKKNDLNYNSIISKEIQIDKFDYKNQMGSIKIPINNLSEILKT